MRIVVNGEPRDSCALSLAALLEELGYTGAAIATALNGSFKPARERQSTPLREGDAVEVVGPMQGG